MASSQPTMLNRPDQTFEIVAWTGRSTKNLRAYTCTSRRIKIDHDGYSSEEKEKLEKQVAWEILETSQSPIADGSKKWWHLVRRAGFIFNGPETENIWSFVLNAVREDFAGNAKVNTQVRMINPADDQKVYFLSSTESS